MIQQFYPPEKLIDILGIGGMNQLGLNQNEVSGFVEQALKARYNTAVDVTPLLGSDRERQFTQAMSLMEIFAKVGVPPPPQLLGLAIAVSDWPGKENLMAQIESAQNQQPQGAT